MAKAPAGIGDLDFESLSDTELDEAYETLEKVRGARREKRLDQIREELRRMGYQANLTPIGQTGREEPREEPRRRRRSTDSEGKQDKRTRQVIPKFQNPH